MQAAQFVHTVAQGDVRPPAGHVGGHGYLSPLSRNCHNIGFGLVLAGIEDLMGDARSGKFPAQQLGIGH